MHKESLTGVLFALLAAIGFSAKAIFIKLAYLDHVDAITLLALRMAFSAPFFIGVAVWLKWQGSASFSRKDWYAVVILGLLGYYLSSLLDFLGLQYISAGLERLILFVYPTITVILSAIIFKKSIGRAAIFAMSLSYAGIVLVFFHDLEMSKTIDGVGHFEIVLGSALVFASALTYSSYLIGTGEVIKHMGATRFTAYASIVASIASLLQFVVIRPFSALDLPLRVYGLSFAMAIFSTVLPVFLLSYAMRRIGSGHTSQIGSIGPVATIGLAYIFLHEPVTPLQITGTALVLAGVLTITLHARK